MQAILARTTLYFALTHASFLRLQSLGNVIQQQSWIIINLSEQFLHSSYWELLLSARPGNVSALQD